VSDIISIPIVEAISYERTSGIHLTAIHCAAAERGVLIKIKKDRKKRKFMGKAVFKT